MLAHTQVVAGTPISHLTLQAVIKGLGKMTVGPLEIAKDPRSVFPLYELEMRLKELIEIHCALFRLCASAEPSEASRRKRSSEYNYSPFAIGGRSGRLVWTRPGTLSIYSAPVQASDRALPRGVIRAHHQMARHTRAFTLAPDRSASLTL